MTLDPRNAALALHRFGFGPRLGSTSGSIAAIASDPQGALLAELEVPKAGQIVDPNLPTSAAEDRTGFEFAYARQAQMVLERRRREAAQAAAAENPGAANAMAAEDKPAEAAAQNAMTPPRKNFLDEAGARIRAAYNADIGFVERLVWFWSNHFCVAGSYMAGAYEREAIRPHVLGRFADMLQAAEGHPAMLDYLDNTGSIGPNSDEGIVRNRGLNENLAREILELHTLGVRTVYTQADVTTFAKVITGWTMLPTRDNPDHGGEFVFNPRMHEPGEQTLIGKTYPSGGVQQGRSVLSDLARHPATAKHIATKLARHFIADEPPPALIDRLTFRFFETEGDLKEVAKALVTAPEAWAAERAKIKRPSEWVVATRRAAGRKNINTQGMVGQQRLLGEWLWQPSAPTGYSDDNAAWLSGLKLRLQSANTFAQAVAGDVEPRELVDATLGPLATAETRQAVARAESKAQALTLLIVAPEFQRR
ncbi:MAG TPA: DUF1800 family protein [Xanthobacteraceae bacterium]|nr:DUF1800 family protein [Xanthobacteraceae bacterium]